MKKITNNKTIVFICFIVLIYCLSILIEKRINPNDRFDFKLWTPYYLIFIFIVPLVVLLPLRLFPTTGYARFLKSWEVRINKIIVVSTGIVLIWILLWYIMIGLGHFMDKSLKISEAEEVAMTSLKNDSIIINRLGLLDSIELTKNSISAKTANFDYILHGKDSILHVEIVLRHNQKWILDSIIIK